EGDPACVCSMSRETIVERRPHPRLFRPVVHGRDSLRHVRLERLSMRIRAEVVVKEKMASSNQAMELDPLAQVRGLVTIDGADAQVRARLLFRDGSPAAVAIAARAAVP